MVQVPTDDVLSLNNSKFGEYVDRIYPTELVIKNTTETERYASHLDEHIEIDIKGGFRTKLQENDQRVDFDFPIVNFPFMPSNRFLLVKHILFAKYSKLELGTYIQTK